MRKMFLAMMIATGLFSASFANAQQTVKPATKMHKAKTLRTNKALQSRANAKTVPAKSEAVSVPVKATK